MQVGRATTLDYLCVTMVEMVPVLENLIFIKLSRRLKFKPETKSAKSTNCDVCQSFLIQICVYSCSGTLETVPLFWF